MIERCLPYVPAISVINPIWLQEIGFKTLEWLRFLYMYAFGKLDQIHSGLELKQTCDHVISLFDVADYHSVSRFT